MASFYCPITLMTVNETNIKKWIVLLKSRGVKPIYSDIFRRFGVKDMDEYVNLIEGIIQNPKSLEELMQRYKTNRQHDLELQEARNKAELKEKILKSSRIYRDNIKIRLLEEQGEEKEEAEKIFQEFCEEVYGNDEEVDNSIVEDYLLKNFIHGIFVGGGSKMAGIVIVRNRKFQIDEVPSKVETFYIQEICIKNEYRGRGYGDLLVCYCIAEACPHDVEYISFMTQYENVAMQMIGLKRGFMQQQVGSGCKESPLLYIRKNDSISLNFPRFSRVTSVEKCALCCKPIMMLFNYSITSKSLY